MEIMTQELAEAHVLKCANCDDRDALVYFSDSSLKRRKYYCVPCAKTLSGYRYAYATASSLARGHGED
jgi:protein-arginine kinase activator protein McsA